MNFTGISPVSSEIPSHPSGNTARVKLIRSAHKRRKERGSKFICENILRQITARCLLKLGSPPLLAVTGGVHKVAGVATKCEPPSWPGPDL